MRRQALRDKLYSNWSVSELLAQFSEFRRTDDGNDILAFRLAGNLPQRSVYVYLYGEDPDLIHFDLEDELAETDEWDHTVHSGSVRSPEELRGVVFAWLKREA
jgi:hypothetical protein